MRHPNSAANVALERSIIAAHRRRQAESELAASVKEALARGVPVNLLARRLDVSRTRIRTLAR